MSFASVLNDLLNQRAQHMTAAENHLEAGRMAEYEAAMEKATALNPKITNLQNAVEEQRRFHQGNAQNFSGASTQNDMAEMGRTLMSGKAVKFSVENLVRGIGLQNNVSTGSTIVLPAGGSSTTRPAKNPVSAIVDQVSTMDLTGLGSYEEGYEVSDMDTKSGKPETTAGTARAATDPAFAKARLNPYEVTTTSFVDRNLSRLSPIAYVEKVQQMASRAIRRKIASLIVNGDGQSSPQMFGITTAKNTAGSAICKTVSLGTALNENSIWNLIAEYGGADSLGGNARLLLSKANLKALGALRGTNEKGKIYKVVPDAGSSTTGYIEDGGLIVPYTILSDIGNGKIAYGDPYDYLLGMFGDVTVRVDESVKAVERMHAVLGDGVIGGNVVVHNGFVIGTIAAS